MNVLNLILCFHDIKQTKIQYRNLILLRKYFSEHKIKVLYELTQDIVFKTEVYLIFSIQNLVELWTD